MMISQEERVSKLTSEKVIFKASTGHKFINKQSLIIFNAVPNKLNKIRVVKLSKEAYLSLRLGKCLSLTCHICSLLLTFSSQSTNPK